MHASSGKCAVSPSIAARRGDIDHSLPSAVTSKYLEAASVERASARRERWSDAAGEGTAGAGAEDAGDANAAMGGAAGGDVNDAS